MISFQIADIGPIVAGIGGIITAWKVFVESRSLSHSKNKENFEFSENFFCRIIQAEDIPAHVVEKGLFIATSCKSLTAIEIAVILQFQNSVDVLHLYSAGKKYLHINRDSKFAIFEFKNKYKSKWRRTLSKSLSLIRYAILMFCAISPILFWERLIPVISASNYILLLLTPLFFVLALISLIESSNLTSAESLIQDQKSNESDKLSVKLLTILEHRRSNCNKIAPSAQ